MTKSSDARQDLIGGLRPHGELGLPVRVRNAGPDSSLEYVCTAMHPVLQLFLGEQGKLVRQQQGQVL
jgi:hypothetical protein